MHNSRNSLRAREPIKNPIRAGLRAKIRIFVARCDSPPMSRKKSITAIEIFIPPGRAQICPREAKETRGSDDSKTREKSVVAGQKGPDDARGGGREDFLG